MGTRTKRLFIAVTLTFVDAFACNYYCGVIWREFAQDLFAKGRCWGFYGYGLPPPS